ncbi:phospho-N-acetylmuramoyl-pentapeptide-transferase [Planctomycetaceae bacterium]|nr:phospho-N-acetylmuramoyl-pentapeptide-transferase [Planctomycetaceae bacterium]
MSTPLAIADPSTALLMLVLALAFCALAAVVCAAAGRLVIPWLVKRKINDGEQRKASDYLRMLHSDKKNTPTMGGAFIVPAWLAVVAVGGGVMTLMGFDPVRVWSALGLGALVVLGNAALGFYDDYCKLTRRGKDGISSRAKLAAQTLIAVASSVGAWWLVGEEGRVLVLPFANVDIGLWMIPLGTFVIVGAGNAYNLTDGLDGLAGGTGSIAFYAMAGGAALIAAFGSASSLSLEAALLGCAASGALLGFLYWNRHPAKVFMGDTGSLSLGALLGFVAVLARLELLLAVVGGVFVVEALSVMLQVGYFKATHGKRIFRCAPLHHHFQFGGWHETKVTRHFVAAACACAFVGLALAATFVRVPENPQERAKTKLPREESTLKNVVVSR